MGGIGLRTLDKILVALTGTFCFLCVLLISAAILFPEFRDNGGSFAVIVLGALTTFVGSVLGGSYFARDLKNAPKQEMENAQGKERGADR